MEIFRDIANDAKSVKDQEGSALLEVPDHPDSLYSMQLQRAFDLLDEKNQDFPFHAGEIHLINLTALLFCDFDFEGVIDFNQRLTEPDNQKNANCAHPIRNPSTAPIHSMVRNSRFAT